MAPAPPFDISQFPTDPSEWPHVVPAYGYTVDTPTGKQLVIHAGDKVLRFSYSGPDLKFSGILGYKSWELLESKDVQIYIGTGAIGVGGILIYFALNGQPIGLLAGTN